MKTDFKRVQRKNVSPDTGSSHRPTRALLDINTIWFGYIAQYLTRLNYFYLPLLRLGVGGGGVSTL
jgi:hypothetical protein